jgi:hypothetical protein
MKKEGRINESQSNTKVPYVRKEKRHGVDEVPNSQSNKFSTKVMGRVDGSQFPSSQKNPHIPNNN